MSSMTQEEFNEKLRIALATMTPGGFHMSKWTGEEIDRKLESIPEAGYVPSSNPNLLYNWYLKDPINQRGKTEYSGSVYGVDMWKNITSITNQKIEADGITVGRISGSTSGSTKNICQLIEDWEWMAGKTFTASALVTRATANAHVRIHDADNTLYPGASLSRYQEGPFLLSITFTLPSEMNELMFVLRSAGTTKDVSATFAAAKLELGTEQTLAHQDAEGNWVLNDPPPNKALELEKCQRYQLMMSYNYGNIGVGFAKTGTTADVVVPLPVTMRHVGARMPVTYDGLYLTDSTHLGSGSIPITGITEARVLENIVRLSCSCAEGLTPGTPVSIQIRGSGMYCLFDANL